MCFVRKLAIRKVSVTRRNCHLHRHLQMRMEMRVQRRKKFLGKRSKEKICVSNVCNLVTRRKTVLNARLPKMVVFCYWRKEPVLMPVLHLQWKKTGCINNFWEMLIHLSVWVRRMLLAQFHHLQIWQNCMFWLRGVIRNCWIFGLSMIQQLWWQWLIWDYRISWKVKKVKESIGLVALVLQYRHLLILRWLLHILCFMQL